MPRRAPSAATLFLLSFGLTAAAILGGGGAHASALPSRPMPTALAAAPAR